MINSTSNKQVRRVVNLKSKAKARREERMYVVEGLRMCRELTPGMADAVYVTQEFASDPGNQRWLEAFRPELVSGAVMNAMADTRTPQGVLAVVRQRAYTMNDILRTDQGKPLAVMVLETIQDPGNLGSIVRAGEGAGITGIIMNRDTADIYNPKVIRSTMGSIFRMPFVYADDLTGACRQMKEQGARLFAAHLKGVHNYDQEDYTDNVGFLIGNEANGLTDETTALADCLVKIPMEGKVESLNAAIAASVLGFESARQRRNRR